MGVSDNQIRRRATGIAARLYTGKPVATLPQRRVGAEPSDSEGQAEILGVVLLLGVTVVAVTALVLAGNAALGQSEKIADVSQAETSFTKLDTDASSVAFGGSPAKEVDLGVGRSYGAPHVDPESGWLRVTLVNATTGATEAEVTNVTLGTVSYERDRTTVTYQGGGVWRSDGGHSTMVSRPEFQLQGKTLTLPVIAIHDGRSGDRLQIAKHSASERKFPNASAGLENKIAGQKVSVTVRSDHYEAWGRHFRRSTNAYVQVDHGARTATAVFPSKGTGPSAFPSGIIATNGNGYLELAGNGAYSDSYSSADGPYTAPGNRNGTVVAAGDVRTTGDSEINGDIWSGRNVTLDGETEVVGDIYWTEDYEQNGAAVSGSNETIPGVASVEPIDFYVEDRVETIRAANDNADTSTITDNEISISDDGGDGLPNGTLTAGRYYLRTMNLSGERLVLDTTDGNVSIAVREYVLMERGGQGNPGSNITVKGDGVVRLYVASDRQILIEKSGHNNLDRDRTLSFYVSIDSEVYVPGNRAPRLRVFGPREFTFAMAGSSSKPTHFNGYIYAPAGRDGPGSAYLKQGQLYGGVVAGNLTIGQNASVHYDMALGDRTIPRSPGVSRLEFMHVGVHRVNVTGT